MSNTKAVEQQEQRIAEIRERLEAATPGPWHSRNSVGYVFAPDCVVAKCGDFGDAELLPFNADRWNADALLVAHSREDVPWLLEQLSSVPSQIEAAVQAERDNQWNGLDEFIDAMQASDNDDGTRLRAAWDLCDVLTAAIRARGEAVK